MATSLAQILAVVKGTKTRSEKATTELHHRTQREALYTGFDKSYRPTVEGTPELPGQRQLVQLNVEDAIYEASKHWITWADVMATQDVANTSARADLVVDGVTLIPQVPAAHLLWLEHLLDEYRQFVEKLPVLDPGTRWSPDGTTGVWRSEEEKTHRTQKVLKVLVKYEATDKHPAQTEPYSIDEPVGEWTTVRFSGAIPASRKRELLDRAMLLLDAVRVAREEANKIEIVQIKEGDRLFSYLLDGQTP